MPFCPIIWRERGVHVAGDCLVLTRSPGGRRAVWFFCSDLAHLPLFPPLLDSARRCTEIFTYPKTKSQAEKNPASPRGVLRSPGPACPEPLRNPAQAVTQLHCDHPHFPPCLSAWSRPEWPLPSSPGSKSCSLWRHNPKVLLSL